MVLFKAFPSQIICVPALDGVAEPSYLPDVSYRKHGYGLEAIGAVVYKYVRDLPPKGYTFVGISTRKVLH